jgi:hypothetical protein
MATTPDVRGTHMHMLEEKEPQEMTFAELMQVVINLRGQATSVHRSAYDDGLMKSFKVLTDSIINNLGVEDSDEDRETAEEIMSEFLIGIGKSHWDNPFTSVKKWDVTVSLDSTSFTVTVEAEDENEAEEMVTQGLEVHNRKMSFTIEYNGTDMECEFEDDECSFEDSECTEDVKVEVERHED